MKRSILARILSGTSDNNIRFGDMCNLLVSLGFNERIKGSHHIFTRTDVDEIVNLQPLGDGKAKPYQVKQLRGIIVNYRLAAED